MYLVLKELFQRAILSVHWCFPSLNLFFHATQHPGDFAVKNGLSLSLQGTPRKNVALVQKLCKASVAWSFFAGCPQRQGKEEINTSQTMVRSLAIGDYDPMCPKMIYIRNEDYILSIDVEPESSFFASLCALL